MGVAGADMGRGRFLRSQAACIEMRLPLRLRIGDPFGAGGDFEGAGAGGGEGFGHGVVLSLGRGPVSYAGWGFVGKGFLWGG